MFFQEIYFHDCVYFNAILIINGTSYEITPYLEDRQAQSFGKLQCRVAQLLRYLYSQAP
jgi:hypothetical protein